MRSANLRPSLDNLPASTFLNRCWKGDLAYRDLLTLPYRVAFGNDRPLVGLIFAGSIIFFN